MAYRPLGQFPQYFLDSGQLNAGGFIYTYETDLTTPKTTYADEGLTIPNENPIPLDASGRPRTDVWGDGKFGMEIADADDVVYLTANNIQPDTGATQAIPPLAEGFLTNDLTNLQWQPVLQVPDPSGYADFILSNDGAQVLWIPQEQVLEPEIQVEANSFRAGISTNPSKYLLQDGSATAPASGAHTTQVSVVYATPFSVAPKVFIEPTTAAVSPGGFLVAHSVIANSVTGFTVKFDTNEDSGTLGNIINPVPFDWVAHGRITVE